MAHSRRRFIRTAAGSAGLVLAHPLLGRAAGALAAGTDRVLVVVNLFGGNDGLNTVIPLDQYDRYRRMRRTLAFDPSEVLALPGVPDLGLNPGLAAIRDLYAQGKVAIINGVGVPEQATGLFDHSAQQFEFQTCDIVRASSVLPPTGWLGRFLDGVTPGVAAPGIDMGGGRLMLTGASFDPLTIYSIDDLQLDLRFDSQDRAAAYTSLMGIPNEDPVGERNRELRNEGLAQAAAIRAATQGYVPAATYPDSNLGYNLQQAAKIILGDLGVRAIGAGTGGFDTHADQRAGGFHDGLLQEVSEAVAAFHADLAGHGDAARVLILTISEFGRTPWENSDGGTDHGFSSVCFAIGDPVAGGVYGLYPGLQDQHLVFDGLTDMTSDFRSVYATAFANFMGVDPVPIVGGSFPVLSFV
jgi:uncharacterized protein (DUF1501 family)